MKVCLGRASSIFVSLLLILLLASCGGSNQSNGVNTPPPLDQDPSATVALSPNASPASAPFTVNIEGTKTSFVQGSTTANFGPGIAVGGGAAGAFGTLTVSDATHASAQISISTSGTLPSSGPRMVAIKTGTHVSYATFTVSQSGTAPIAVAGNPQAVKKGDTVRLDGSGSISPTGTALIYAWSLTKPDGTNATLASAVTTTFVADQDGIFLAQLTVASGGTSTASWVPISTTAGSPVANAGVAQLVTVGSTVQLDGSKSTDPNGNALTYSWKLTAAPAGSSAAASLSPSNTVNPTFKADLAGPYIAELTVNDGQGNTSTNSVTIGTSAAAPTSITGTAISGKVGDTIILDGSKSVSPSGTTLTYSWALISKPSGSTATITNPSSVVASLKIDVTGNYVAQLTVTGPAAADQSSTDPTPKAISTSTTNSISTVLVSTDSVPPSAVAGPTQKVAAGSTVNLDGSSSKGTAPLKFAWSLLTKPSGSTAALTGATTATPSFKADLAGAYVAQLIVTDGLNLVGTPSTILIIGTTPKISIDPASLTFGDQTQGVVSNSKTLTVTNNGDGDLSLTGVTITGTNASDFAFTGPTFPQTVTANGGTTTINVTFKPGSTGARAASLSIASNAATAAPAVSLSGNGISASVNITPNPAVFTTPQAVNTTSSALAVTVKNPGPGTLVIQNFGISGANAADFNFSASSTPITLASGESTVVNITFTPTGVGTRTAILTLTDTADSGSHSVTLTGTGTAAAISLNPPNLNFGNQFVGITGSNSVVVTNSGGAPLTISSISLGGSNPGDFAITSSTSNIVVPANGTTTISLTFTPSAAVGRSAILNIAHNANGTASPLTLNISGTGVLPTITATPLDFGSQTINIASSARPISVTNPSTGPLTISSITISGANASEFTSDVALPSSPVTLPSGGSLTFNITFKPTATGARTANFTITDNVQGSPRVIALTGIGAAPGFSSTPNPFDFGNQTVNQASATKVMTITNTGAGNLILSAAAITGANASDFVLTTPITTAITLPQNGTQNLSFTFTPGAAGARTASLNVTDNAGNHSITISGNGATPTISVPSTLSFGNQAVSTASSAQPITISNTGLGNLVIRSIQIGGTNAADFSFTSGTLPLTVAPGANTTVNVVFTPSNPPGPKAASLSISDNATGSPHSVALSGTGTAPAITLTPNPLNFGSQAVGQATAASGMTISNTGTGDLIITAINVSGTNATDFTLTPVTLPLTIHPSTSATISLTFTPSAGGGRVASVDVTDNIAGGSTQSAGLQGSGLIPGISAAPNPLNFGNQLVLNSSAPTSISITNTGAAPLVISSFTITGANASEFVSTTATPITIAGGNSSPIVVKFTPTGTGTRTATITLATNVSGAASFPIALTGIGIAPAVSLNQTSLSFGNQIQNTTSAPQSVTLTNSGTAPLTVSPVTASANFAQTSNCVGSIAAGANCTINVTFTPTTTGVLNGTLTITDTATGSPHTVSLSGTGTIPAISALPNPLTFPGQLLNTTSTASQITISNPGTADLVINSLSIVGGNFGDFTLASVIPPITVTPGTSISLNITFKPTALGARTSTLSIGDNVAGSPHLVTLNGTGTSPIYNASPTSLTFTGQLVNSTSGSQPVTISNTGTGPMTVTSIVASGDFAQTNNCGSTIAASASCIINVTFTPTAIGSRTGSITITDSAPGSPHTIGLTGTGTAPNVTFSPTTGIAFGNQNLGSTSSAQTLLVNNTGTGPLTISGVSISGTNSGDFNLTPVTTPITVQAGGSKSFTITFTPGAKGARSATFTITDNTTAGTHSVGLTGTGVGVPIASITPPTINFGNINAGVTSPAATITVNNTGTDDLVVSSVALTGTQASQFSVPTAGFTVPPGQSTTLSVTFTPSGSGARSANVVFTDNAAGSPHSVALNGTGTAPIATVSTNSLNFGNQPVNDPTMAQTFPVTLQNTGNGPLSVTSVTITGTNAAEFTAPVVTPTTLQAGQILTVNVTFLPYQGGVRTAALTFNDNGFGSSQQIVNLQGTGTAIGTLFAPGITVGSNLEAQVTSQLGPAQPSDTDIKITSSDPSVVLLSTDPSAAGSASVTITISAGASISNTAVYVQAVGAAGSSATLIETAKNMNAAFATVTVVPSGFVLATPAGLGSDFSTATTAGAQQLSIQAARLENPSSPVLNVRVRGGFNVSVPVTSATTSVGTISTSPAVVTGGQTLANTNFVPVAPGTSLISIGVPAGFADPGANTSATATVTSPTILLGAVNVGLNLQTNVHVNLGSPAPGTGLIVTLSSSDSSKMVLSTSATTVGSGSIQVVVPANGSQSPDFYVQGLALADGTSNLKITATASGYGSTNSGVQVTPSGFTIRTSTGTPGVGFSTTTQSGDTVLTLESYRLDSSLNWVTNAIQGIRAGISVNVTVTSSSTSVGTIAMSPATFTANQKTASVRFQSVGQGTSTITAVTPNNFSTPASGAAMTATVTVPQVSLQFSSNSLNVIGKGLQGIGSGALNTATLSDLNVTIVSSDPSTIALSNSATAAGTGQIVVVVKAGNGLNGAGFPLYYLQALKKSATPVTLTATAPGFGTATMQVTAVGAGFVLSSSNGIGADFGTSILHGDVTMNVIAIPINDSGVQLAQPEGIAGGTSAVVPVNTGTPAVGQFVSGNTPISSVTLMPGTGGVGENGSDVQVTFRPLSPGTTALSVTQPAAFTAPATGTSLTATVVQ